MSLQEEFAAYLEKLGSALTGLDEGLHYSNLLLLRMLLALGIEPPEAVKPLLELLPKAKMLPAIAVPLGRPISELDRVTTTSQTYVDVVEWEIPAQHSGELFEISMTTNNFAKSQFRLVLANEEQWTDKYLISALTQPFSGNRLAELMKVLIQAKSSDGTEITVYGAIAGKLIAPEIKSIEGT